MIKRLALLGLLLASVAFGRVRVAGYCEDGGVTVKVSGQPSNAKVQGSFPGCTVSVFLTGTSTLATIYADNFSTPLSNPFTTAANGDGYWFYYADDGTWDIRLSGGGILTPFTRGAVSGLDPFIVPYTDQYVNFAAAWANIPVGGALVLSGTQSGPVTLNGTNRNLICLPGATIRATSNAAVLTITGTGISVTGPCHIDGRFSQSGFTASGIVINGGASNVLVNGAQITNSGNQGIGCGAASHIRITGVAISGTKGDPIACVDNVNDLEIDNSRVDSTGGSSGVHSISVHTAAAGAFATNINVHDMQITEGSDNFGLEIGGFGGLPASGIQISNIKCTMTVDSNGCVSLSTVDHAVINGVQLDAGGHHVQIAALEIVVANVVEFTNIQGSNFGTGTVPNFLAIDGSKNVNGSNIDGEGCVGIGVSNPTYFVPVNINITNINLHPLSSTTACVAIIFVHNNSVAGSMQNINITGLVINDGHSLTDLGVKIRSEAATSTGPLTVQGQINLGGSGSPNTVYGIDFNGLGCALACSFDVSSADGTPSFFPGVHIAANTMPIQYPANNTPIPVWPHLYGGTNATKAFGVDYVATEDAGSANDAIKATGSYVGNPPPGYVISILLSHTIAAAAGISLAYNGGGPLPIRSHRNPSSVITSAYAVSGIITLQLYSGGAWLDVSQ